jgi:hypothetical protein
MSRETSAANIGMLVMDFINALRDDNLEWHENTQDRRNDLRVKQKLHGESINQEIQKLKLKFEQDIHTMEHEFQFLMKKETLKTEAEIKNYQRFLDSIEDLREKLEEVYPNMPPALILVIHEYATQLLYKLWDSPDGQDKLTGRKDLVKFLALVSEDTDPLALQAVTNNQSAALPHKTLKYIREQDT